MMQDWSFGKDLYPSRDIGSLLFFEGEFIIFRTSARLRSLVYRKSLMECTWRNQFQLDFYSKMKTPCHAFAYLNVVLISAILSWHATKRSGNHSRKLWSAEFFLPSLTKGSWCPKDIYLDEHDGRAAKLQSKGKNPKTSTDWEEGVRHKILWLERNSVFQNFPVPPKQRRRFCSCFPTTGCCSLAVFLLCCFNLTTFDNTTKIPCFLWTGNSH